MNSEKKTSNSYFLEAVYRESNENEFINSEDLSLERWLKLLRDKSKDTLFVDYHFPTEDIREEFLNHAVDYPKETIDLVLRSFLMPSGNLRHDYWQLQVFISILQENSGEAKSMIERIPYYRRLLTSTRSKGKFPVWEGITWVIDLLPYSPDQALNALEAYFSAHAYCLPDGRMIGISDAMSVIRTRYLKLKHPREILYSLSPDQFEHLVEELFFEMGYKTELTRKTHDGGIDIIATREEPGIRERNLIQCKRTKANVGVEVIRELLGVVSNERATKGTLVTTAEFTATAKKLADETTRIDAIGQTALQLLLNKHLGPTWPRHLDFTIARSIKRNSADR